MKRLWRKLFPVRVQVVHHETGGVITHVNPFREGLVLVTRQGRVLFLNYSFTIESFSLTEITEVRP